MKPVKPMTSASSMKKRGDSIDIRITDFLKKQPHPVSTREISIETRLSWHTAINHCLRLQMAGKVYGYKIGNLNVWEVKNE